MKIIRIILRIPVCLLCLILALAFVVIEGHLFVTCEFRLFENSTLALIQQCVKVLISLYACTSALGAIVFPNKSFFREGILFLSVSLASAPFLTNHIGLCFIFLSVLFILTDIQLWKTRR